MPLSLREYAGQALVKIGKERNDFVVIDCDVAGGTGIYHFRDTFPNRFIQCGIAEQNAMSMCAGLSTTGVIPIFTSYAMFAVGRTWEQIRNSIAYPNFNVKIIASHVGVDVGPDGASHQCLEDIAIMRAIPGMVILSPTNSEMESAINWMLDYKGPVYLRTGRSNIPFELKTSFKFNKATLHRIGDRASLVATGNMVYRAIQAADILAGMNIDVDVISMSTIKPIDKTILINRGKYNKKIITCEDHNINGGLFGAVAEALADCSDIVINSISIDNKFGQSGDPDELAKYYELDVDSIVRKVKKYVK